MFKKVILPAFIVVFFIIVIIGFVIMGPYFLHNAALRHFTNQLNDYPLPANSTFIDSFSECGLLSGNGDHMDYFACIIIKSHLPIEALVDYYYEAEFKSVDGNPIKAEIAKTSDSKVLEGLYVNQDIIFRKIRTLENNPGYYIIYIYAAGYCPLWDIRGC